MEEELVSLATEIEDITREIQILKRRREELRERQEVLIQLQREQQQWNISNYHEESGERGREMKNHHNLVEEENENNLNCESIKTRVVSVDEEHNQFQHKYHDILTQTLQSIFHYSSYRPGQLELIKYSLLRYDVFGVMKTSGGKSLCYQLPAFISSHKLTLVICPLLALIYDQVNYLNNLTPNCALTFSHAIEKSQHYEIYRHLDAIGTSGNCVKFLYVTPEKIVKSKLLMTHLQKAYDRDILERIVIDEAHCASQWGHDFRPDYAKLNILRTVFPNVPIMLLTATANLTVRNDLIRMMRLGESNNSRENMNGIKGLKVFISDFDRPNLHFSVVQKPADFNDCLDTVISIISETIPRESGKGHVIIYCFSQKDCEKVAAGLSEKGCYATPYHAGLNESQREHIQRQWMNGNRLHQIICATIAFGLGINVPTVRLVLHFTISKSLELYYQEAGRAGRDGKPAKCVIFYSPDDMFKIAALAVGDVERCPISNQIRPKVFNMVRYCHTKVCRRISFQQSIEGSHLLPHHQRNSEKNCHLKNSEQSREEFVPCDNCLISSYPTEAIDDEEVDMVLRICQVVIESITEHERASLDQKSTLTLNKLMNTKHVKGLLKELKNTKTPSRLLPSTSAEMEFFIVSMIERCFLDLSIHFTPYSTLCYITSGVSVPSRPKMTQYLQSYKLKFSSDGIQRNREKEKIMSKKKRREVHTKVDDSSEKDARELRSDSKRTKYIALEEEDEDFIDLT